MLENKNISYIYDCKSDRQDALLMRPLSVDSLPPLLGLMRLWQRIYATRASRLELTDNSVSKQLVTQRNKMGNKTGFYMKHSLHG